MNIIIRESIEKYIIQNNGMISTKEAKNLNINAKNLERMEKEGDLKRLAHGLYLHKDFEKDLLYLSQFRASKAIYSHDTALYLHGLIDRIPEVLTLTIPSGWYTNLTKEKEKYKFFYQKEELWKLGQMKVYSPQGNIVKVYDVEKSICDYLIKIDGSKDEDVSKLFSNYLNRKDSDINKLLEYAAIFSIKEEIDDYLEEFSNKQL